MNRGNIQNPEVSNTATQPGMQQVQIVRSGDGKIYVHGLHQGLYGLEGPNVENIDAKSTKIIL